jgi:uncharacterized protein (DUF1330 family)
VDGERAQMMNTQRSAAKADVSATSNAKSPVYLIGLVNIQDRDEYNKYVDGFRPILSRYKGEILVVEEEPTVLEGDWPFTRTVVIRFPDEAEATQWYESEDYQNLAKHRFRAAQAKIIFARGRI